MPMSKYLQFSLLLIAAVEEYRLKICKINFAVIQNHQCVKYVRVHITLFKLNAISNQMAGTNSGTIFVALKSYMDVNVLWRCDIIFMHMNNGSTKVYFGNIFADC